MNKPKVGRAEAVVLQYIADHPDCTVTEVGDYLAETKGQTRNTALTMMERLRTKGFLERTKADGVFRYRLQQSKRNMVEGLIQDFVDSVLGGSITPLVAYLTQKGEVTDAQLQELKGLFDGLEDEADGH
jgi:predicted transcriptional regulator